MRDRTAAEESDPFRSQTPSRRADSRPQGVQYTPVSISIYSVSHLQAMLTPVLAVPPGSGGAEP